MMQVNTDMQYDNVLNECRQKGSQKIEDNIKDEFRGILNYAAFALILID